MEKQKVLSNQQLKAGLMEIRSLIECYHPDPYAHNTPEKFDNVYQKIMQELTNEISFNDFCVFIFQYIALLRDYHSFVSFSICQNGKRVNPIKSFPMTIRKFTDGYYITNGKIPKQALGKKIVSINQIDIAQVVDRLHEYTVSETETHFQKNVVRLLPRPSFLYQVMPKQERVIYSLCDEIKISFSNQDLCFEKVIWDRPNPHSIYYDQAGNIKYEDDHHLSFPTSLHHNEFDFFDQDNIGYYKLEVSSSAGLKPVLKKFFSQVTQKQVRRIILDLRGNPGGMASAGIQFMEYLQLQHKDLATHIYFRNKYGLLRYDVMHYVTHLLYKIVFRRGNIRSKYSLYPMMDGQERVVENIRAFSWAGLIYPDNRIERVAPSKKYTGQVAILTDGQTGSAAVILLNLFKFLYPNHLIIGSLPAESPLLTDNVFSTEIFPGLRVFLPSAKHYFESHSLEPDYFVVQTIADFQQGVDTVLQYALLLKTR